MLNHHMAFTLVGMVLTLGCDAGPVKAPPRVGEVPATAVWAGGVDGGHWFDCHRLAGGTPRYECSIYNDYTGEVEARGQFVGGPAPVEDLTFRFYDGAGRIALSDSTWLLAVDTLDYPFGDGSGKRAVFRPPGHQVGDAVQY